MVQQRFLILCLLLLLGSHTALAEADYPRRISSSGPINTDNIFLLGAGAACSPSPATFGETLTIMAELLHPELNSETLL